LRSELTEGKNLYVYVGNNPVNQRDPVGLYTLEYYRYKQWYWWWGWKYKWIYYGWKLKLTSTETGVLGVSVGAAGAAAVLFPEPISTIVGLLVIAEATFLGTCAVLGKGAVFYCYHLYSPCPLPCGPGTAGVGYQWCE